MTKKQNTPSEKKLAVIDTLIKRRIKKGWSQTDLAQAIGSRQPTISCLEQGGCNPTLQTLEKIAEALDMRLDISMKRKR